MTATGALLLTADELLVVVSDLWDATFKAPVREVGLEPDPDDRWWAAADLLLEGAVVAEVVVLADGPSLRAAASHTFNDPDPADHLLIDVLAEAANIIAGNIKGILRLDTQLSFPRAGRGTPPVTPDRPIVSTRTGDDWGRRLSVYVIDHGGRPVADPAPEEDR